MTPIRHTALIHNYMLSKISGSEVYLKPEYLQKTGSFKIRGAYHKLKSLPKGSKVVAASAGNHAQGVAYAAKFFDMKCTIVMPRTASPAKVAATKSYGADVVLYGNNYDEAASRAQKIPGVMVHAFDDPLVIKGQGTVGTEIVQDMPDVDEIYLPIGGGGLAAGVVEAVKPKYPHIRIVGIQSAGSPGTYNLIKNASFPHFWTIADGITVHKPGDMTIPGLHGLDDIVLVDDDSITKAIFLMLERMKTVVEPAGAVTLAHVITNKPAPGKKVVCIVSGGNIDMYSLGQVVNRGLFLSQRLVKVQFTLPDRPGTFKMTVDAITEADANIVEVEHDRLRHAGTATVTISMEVHGPDSINKMLELFKAKGLDYVRLT